MVAAGKRDEEAAISSLAALPTAVFAFVALALTMTNQPRSK
jgi:hypothetical protein